MKRILFCVVFLLVLGVRPAFAAAFTKASIRFDRIKTNSALSGLVCATPSSPSAGTEAKVSITFPSDFTINNTTSNWTTSTTNIPSGSSPWPGITTNPLTISGNEVTFGSNDLTTNSQYCFTFVAASSLTGSIGNKTGYITTRTGSDVILEQSEYGIVIANNDQVSIHGTVPADTSDFNATLSQTTAGNTFPQDAKVSYNLSYNNYLSYPVDLTVEAAWDLGVIQGQSNPSVDVFSYVSGSATNAYNNASPVIDIPNRKIQWNITSFPGNSSGQVTFQLQMSGNYRESQKVAFAVRGRVVSLNAQSLDSIIIGTYLYNYSSSQASAITPTASLTPPMSMQSLTIDNISMREIASTAASIQLNTSLPAKYTIRYGTSKTDLSSTLQGTTLKKSQTISLTHLLPGKRYYFLITVTDDTGRKTVSDLSTFTTSTTPSPILLPSLLVSAKDVILLQKFLGNLYLPINTPVMLELKPTSSLSIQDMDIILYDKNGQRFDVSRNSLVESLDGSYTGEIVIPDMYGTFDAYARIDDYSGNSKEIKIMTVYALSPLLVRDAFTHHPIEHARLLFTKKNNANLFITLPNTTAFQNPFYTTGSGIFDGALPDGTYAVSITAVGYTDKTVPFKINTDGYPTIDLIPLPFSIGNFLTSIISSAITLFTSLQTLLGQLAFSQQYFYPMTGIGFVTLAWITFLSLAQKLRVSLSLLPWYLFIGLPLTLLPHKKRTITGRISTGKNDLSGSDIVLLDRSAKRTLAHTKSREDGSFSLIYPPVSSWILVIQKKGYHTEVVPMNHFTSKNITIHLEATDKKQSTVKSLFSIFTTEIGHFLFEGFLLLSVGVIVLFGKTFGMMSVLPLMISTSICGIYWLLHLLHLRQSQEIGEKKYE